MKGTLASTDGSGQLLEFLYRLGQAYLASGEQTAEVERIIRQSAAAYGCRRPRVVAFPTAIFLGLEDHQGEHVTFAEGPTQNLRLDQISGVYHLGEEAQQGEVDPVAGISRIQEILRQPPRFGVAGLIGGHAILSVGFALVLTPSLTNLAATAVFGAMVGSLKVFNRNRPSLSVHMPVVAAAIVSASVFLLIKWKFPLDPLHVLIPPLVTYLPGARLTLGMVELAYGDMVSGSSRLITGFVQLLLLAMGLLAGAILVGYSAENLVDVADEPVAYAADQWTPWLGVSIFALGAYFHFSAPRGSLRWMWLAALVAFAAQQLTVDLVGETASGFFGMLAATPLSYLIQNRFKGPPSMVSFLPAFWILVPGGLSLLGVKQMLSDRDAGIDGLLTALAAIVSIAMGTLFGASIYKWLVDTKRYRRLHKLRIARWFRRRH